MSREVLFGGGGAYGVPENWFGFEMYRKAVIDIFELFEEDNLMQKLLSSI